MASIASSLLPSPPSSLLDQNPNPNHRFPAKTPLFLRPKRPLAPLRRCRNPSSDSSGDDEGGGGGRRGWDSLIQDVVKSAVKRWDDYVSAYRKSKEEVGVAVENANIEKEEEVEEEEKEGVWDWERWKRHFAEMEEQEMIVSVLKV